MSRTAFVRSTLLLSLSLVLAAGATAASTPPATPAKPAAAPAAAAPAAVAKAGVADAKKGRATFEAACAECHEAADLKGPAGKAFAAKSADIVAGKAKHRPKLKITAAEAADVAAYVATLK